MMKTVRIYKRPLAMIAIMVAGFALGSALVGFRLVVSDAAGGAVVSAEAARGQTGYTTIFRDPNGPGPDGKRFVGRRNYTIISGQVIDQSKGFDI